MIYVDDRIFRLQAQGGISHLWRNLIPYLQDQDTQDVFISTYYAPAPHGMKSLVMAYDFIAERYRPIGAYNSEAVEKRQSIARADGVVAISLWTANDCMTYTGKPAQVAYCGTDIQRAHPAHVADFMARYKITRPYVMVVGNRHLYKNVQALYQSWEFFQGRDSHMILCVGGEEPNHSDLSFARDYPGQWAQVRLSDEDMAAAYTGASMLVYPSMYEGFGLPVLEAMACGCPVVCGHRGALPEVVQDTAHYADIFRPVTIAAAMNEALLADYIRQEKAMQIARAFTWERMAKRIIQAAKDIA